MDKRVKEMYILMLTKNARVVHFIEYDDYYEIHLEWGDEPLPPGVISIGSYFDDDPPRQYIQKKLIALEKIRR